MSSLSNHLALLTTSGHHFAGLVHTAPSNIYHTPCVFFAAHTTRRTSPPRKSDVTALARSRGRRRDFTEVRPSRRRGRRGRGGDRGQNGLHSVLAWHVFFFLMISSASIVLYVAIASNKNGAYRSTRRNNSYDTYQLT